MADIQNFDIALLKAAIDELKNNPNACKAPSEMFSETELSPKIEEFFNYVVWENPLNLRGSDTDMDTIMEKFGELNYVKYHSISELCVILGLLAHRERFNSGLIHSAFETGYLLEVLEHMLKLIIKENKKLLK
ncbi:MAG: hypothetical protein IJM09_05190 [Neisseriaceae bacterium]|nr:hypothetical protein [Neisseriaceae bacterium]